jgi:hypothetical protein
MRELFSRFRRIFSIRFDKSPIDSSVDLIVFVQTRSAYVAQTSLYGYLKKRMGIKYPLMFQDENLLVSINLAKWRIYASCLSDMAVFSAAIVGAEGRLNERQISDFARFCFDSAVAQTFAETDYEELQEEIRAEFATRTETVNWANAALGENAFTTSPAALVHWAPIADRLKVYDKEIVTNSIRFRWRDVREQLRKRIVPEEIASRWQSGPEVALAADAN